MSISRSSSRKQSEISGLRVGLKTIPSGGKKTRTRKCDPLTAITHKERIAILESLSTKSKNVSDLHRETGLDRATVRYHLGLLEKCGIIKSEYVMLDKPDAQGRVGRYYSINKKGMGSVLSAIDERKQFLRKLAAP